MVASTCDWTQQQPQQVPATNSTCCTSPQQRQQATLISSAATHAMSVSRDLHCPRARRPPGTPRGAAKGELPKGSCPRRSTHLVVHTATFIKHDQTRKVFSQTKQQAPMTLQCQLPLSEVPSNKSWTTANMHDLETVRIMFDVGRAEEQPQQVPNLTAFPTQTTASHIRPAAPKHPPLCSQASMQLVPK
jgi:hypothetical protein